MWNFKWTHWGGWIGTTGWVGRRVCLRVGWMGVCCSRRRIGFGSRRGCSFRTWLFFGSLGFGLWSLLAGSVLEVVGLGRRTSTGALEHFPLRPRINTARDGASNAEPVQRSALQVSARTVSTRLPRTSGGSSTADSQSQRPICAGKAVAESKDTNANTRHQNVDVTGHPGRCTTYRVTPHFAVCAGFTIGRHVCARRQSCSYAT